MIQLPLKPWCDCLHLAQLRAQDWQRQLQRQSGTDLVGRRAVWRLWEGHRRVFTQRLGSSQLSTSGRRRFDLHPQQRYV